jgi:tetratricopeptide (TPR) repeat protein/glycosyltransferase involved in cell wall biosynthesis
MQTRPNVFLQRGGDTIVLERLSKGLQNLGILVTVDPVGDQDPRSYDVVHLYNFATPAITQQQAARARAVGVPFVVTTLYEDTPQFHSQSHYAAVKLLEYVSKGQPAGGWMLSMQELSRVPQSGRFPVDEIASTAAALMPNGKGEAIALQRDFPNTRKIMEVQVGSEIGACVGPELFERTYGLRDFVFCVGRLESRKNQLMLLKALEHSDVPVVLAAGAFSYQPEYEAAIRAFKRRGKTLILGHIEPEMLSSAYAACRVHALPSWYELPGLVSLEAAAHNKNIVVTRTGTTADYVGDKGFYCLPWDSDSIHAAVMAAFYAPVREGLVEMAHSFSWDNSVRQTVEVYKSVVSRSDWLSDESNGAAGRCSSAVPQGENTMSLDAKDFQDLLERGEQAAKNSDFDTATECLAKAAALQPNSTRVMKAQGAVLLAQSRPVEAGEMFDRALRNEPNDPKLLAGRGMCDLLQQKPTTAIGFFERALSFAPDYLVALHQLLECSYGLGRYDSAIAALHKYLSLKPEDIDIRFCLAGCLFKSGQAVQAEIQLDAILASDPAHVGAKELRNIIRAGVDGRDQASKAAATPAATPLVSSVSGADFRTSLSELSDKIKSWRVGAPAPKPQEATPPAAPDPDAQAEFGTVIGDIEDLKRAGEFDKAGEALAKFLERRNIPDSYLEIAKCLQAEFTVLKGDLLTASAMYDAILRQNSKAARALCGKGAIAAEGNEWQKAREFFDRALAADSDCDVAYAGLGLCAMIENKTDQAFDLFSIATQKNPENNRALLGVLQTGYPLKRYSEMERMLTAFLDLHPGNLDILYSFAGVLFAQGKVQEAKLEVEKILIFEPQHEHALELRGMIEKTSGNSVQVQ